MECFVNVEFLSVNADERTHMIMYNKLKKIRRYTERILHHARCTLHSRMWKRCHLATKLNNQTELRQMLKFCSQIHSPLLGDKVDYDMVLWYRPPANEAWRAGIRQPYFLVNLIPLVRDYELGLLSVDERWATILHRYKLKGSWANGHGSEEPKRKAHIRLGMLSIPKFTKKLCNCFPKTFEKIWNLWSKSHILVKCIAQIVCNIL